jgi:hypothetical protein
VESATGRFDAEIMGGRVYEKPFEVIAVGPGELPVEKYQAIRLGRHLEGCRIGFDLGASDRKAAAVVDGQVVFSEEIDWSPVPQADPQWHFDQIMDSLTRAAARLPRVDAIGGSSAGVYVNNDVKLSSLFRGVPPAVRLQVARPLDEGERFVDLDALGARLQRARQRAAEGAQITARVRAIGRLNLIGMSVESEWRMEYQAWATVAKLAMGAGILRPESSVELATA